MVAVKKQKKASSEAKVCNDREKVIKKKKDILGDKKLKKIAEKQNSKVTEKVEPLREDSKINKGQKAKKKVSEKLQKIAELNNWNISPVEELKPANEGVKIKKKKKHTKKENSDMKKNEEFLENMDVQEVNEETPGKKGKKLKKKKMYTEDIPDMEKVKTTLLASDPDPRKKRKKKKNREKDESDKKKLETKLASDQDDSHELKDEPATENNKKKRKPSEENHEEDSIVSSVNGVGNKKNKKLKKAVSDDKQIIPVIVKDEVASEGIQEDVNVDLKTFSKGDSLRNSDEESNIKPNKNIPNGQKQQLADQQDISTKNKSETSRMGNQDPRQKICRNVHKLTHYTFVVGQRILGCISEVYNDKLVITLPHKIIATVPNTKISKTYSKLLKKSAEESDNSVEVTPLKDLFSCGRHVVVCVDKIHKVNGRKQASFSLKPMDVGSHLAASDLMEGLMITCAVRYIKPSGFILDTGILRVGAYLPSTAAQGLDVAGIGSVLQCIITEVQRDKGKDYTWVTVSADSKAVNNATMPVYIPKNISLIVPGTVIRSTVSKVYAAFMSIKVAKHQAFVHRYHLKHPLETFDSYKEGMDVVARVLYIQKKKKQVHCTLQEDINFHNSESASPGDLKVGDIIDEAEVIKSEINVFVKLNPEAYGYFLKRPAEKTKFPIGSKISCKIKQYFALDKVYSVIPLRKSPAFVGQKVDCVVKEIQEYLIIVTLKEPAPAIDAKIPLYHLHDNVEKWDVVKNSLAIGDDIQDAVVFSINRYTDECTVTLKTSINEWLTTCEKRVKRKFLPSLPYPAVVKDILKYEMRIDIPVGDKGFMGVVNHEDLKSIWRKRHCIAIGTTIWVKRIINKEKKLVFSYVEEKNDMSKILQLDTKNKKNAVSDMARSLKEYERQMKMENQKMEEEENSEKIENDIEKEESHNNRDLEEKDKSEEDNVSSEDDGDLDGEENLLSESKPCLSIGGSFVWDVPETPAEKEESSDSEDEEQGQAQKKKAKKLSKAEQLALAKQEEQRLFEMESARLDKDRIPESAMDYEELLQMSPNSSAIWIKYISFHLESAEVEKAKATARRALTVINMQEEKERLNIWTVILRLEVLYGTSESAEEAFSEARLRNDSQKVHEAMAMVYAESNKIQEASKMYHIMTKKFGKDLSVWNKAAFFYYQSQMFGDGRLLLDRALMVLEKRNHVELISRFAQLEFKFGEPERGKSMFESLITNCPQRIDLWSVYVDVFTKRGDIEEARGVLGRMMGLKLRMKKMRAIFKKCLDFESTHGTPATVNAVKRQVQDYLSCTLGDD